ncbi:hypothetical protein [Nocardioides nitrophenolicus]|uniref:hypothetical protein n=1 Tax=Nocardioides nitrophenolicus TaxID=60489 RepID=UPI0019595494|nr:hypothetical protein [Nocardioides nitrophenolicus]MBM7517664.1 hypothetical protein [Nocardioides nitrophenolicus]
MAGGPERANEYAAALAARIRAAIISVEDDLRSMPQAEAEEILAAALGADAPVLGTLGIRRTVRHVKDPLWILKHPLRSRRELRDS